MGSLRCFLVLMTTTKGHNESPGSRSTGRRRSEEERRREEEQEE